jgi:hypothetical protein
VCASSRLRHKMHNLWDDAWSVPDRRIQNVEHSQKMKTRSLYYSSLASAAHCRAALIISKILNRLKFLD